MGGKRMAEYEFSFVVSGVDPGADDFEDRFAEAGCDDATLMQVNGLVAVAFVRKADNYAQAVISAYQDVLTAGATLERFEPDFLVSKAEIASRANITRAAVTNYVAGDRGANFPTPCARITTASPLWDWVEVARWLHRIGILPHEEIVKARVSRTVNRVIQHQRESLPGRERNLAQLLENAGEQEASA